KTYKKAAKEKEEAARIAAIEQAVRTRHDKIIRAIGNALLHDTDNVRIAAAKALGTADHPTSVDVLVAALEVNRKKPDVLQAIAAALGALGWQKGALALHVLLENPGEANVRESLEAIVDALGSIGSASSVEPLIDLLALTRGRRRLGRNVERRINAALAAITGGDKDDAKSWKEWWKGNKNRLFEVSKSIYWSKKTYERTEVPRGEKAPKDALLVVVRLVDPPPPEQDGGRGRRRRRDPKGP
ncbi:MAG: HEAT repeat domain-containing protein, partial [Planctomycetota bacterium]